MEKFEIPLSVKADKKEAYRLNYLAATLGRGRLFLVAGDQKVEHLNDDFFGPGIAAEDAEPEHLFQVAAASRGGVLATHLGLISRYGRHYPKLPYIVKVNGRSHLGPNDEKDSSRPWWSVEDIVKFKSQSRLNIVGLGYTLYLGGKYEARMLKEAAQLIFSAHQAGLIVVLWIYPRGKGIKEEDIQTIAGAAGIAAALDADFVKLKYPYSSKDKNIAKKYQTVIKAAGRTKVICVGGSKRSLKDMLTEIKGQVEISGSAGVAIGRNLHQRSIKDASKLSDGISQILFGQPKKKSSRFLGIF